MIFRSDRLSLQNPMRKNCLKPKLALICTERNPVPPIRGGAIQTYIAGVLPYLSKSFDVTVVSVPDPSLPLVENKNGVRYIRFAEKYVPEQYYGNIVKFIASEEFDLIEIFNRPYYVKDIAEVAPTAKIVLSLHNEMLKLDRIERQKARECLERVFKVVTISNFIRNGVCQLYPEYQTKITSILAGVDLEVFKPFWRSSNNEITRSLERIGRQVKRPILLAVARLSPKKGTHVLIPAMEQVLKKYPTASLVIVGSKRYGSNQSDPYVTYVQDMAKPYGDAISFTGYVPYDRVADYFRVADIFVCASQWEEPLARIHYEAMAAGLPIVTTDRGGNLEPILEGNNCVVARPYDHPDGFTEAISYLLDRTEKRELMGKNNRLLAEQNYSWKRVADDLMNLFHDAML